MDLEHHTHTQLRGETALLGIIINPRVETALLVVARWDRRRWWSPDVAAATAGSSVRTALLGIIIRSGVETALLVRLRCKRRC